ncbi:MAG: malto-oligosyltrehalose trehalohydrolase [Chthoniobacterales bacterium]
MKEKERSQGAEVRAAGVLYRTWAPGHDRVDVVLYDARGEVARTVSLGKEADGYFSAVDPEGRAGDRYKYRFNGQEWPDPASRSNPDGVHGAAVVIDPRDFSWHDEAWVGPPLADLVIYELHLGTFTWEGTFRGAIERLDDLVRLGVSALEIMPVAAFPGARNWGYDGVLLYAPARVYGTPNDFRALVDAAHAHGLAVILDVVYNHLGPDGNYLGTYSPAYFHPEHKTPWGDAFNFELKPVREFFAENPEYWRREFHIDGFRLDATHAIVDASEPHFLAEVAERVHSLGGFVTIEDERNEPRLLLPVEQGGLGLDGSWADDFHHVVRVLLTGEREGYYGSYQGTLDELTETLRDGWLLHGDARQRKSAAEAAECAELRPDQLVFCIANHDQVGNQAFGRRLQQLCSPEEYRAASALLCLAPYTPLLFMGQEWAASAPFQFFTDYGAELGRLTTLGRREEFKSFSLFRDPAARAQIPDPQAKETFLRSKLDWTELDRGGHAATLRLYVELLRLRRTMPALQDRARDNWKVSQAADGILQMTFGVRSPERCAVLVDLTGGHEDPLRDDARWELLLSTNEERFGGTASAPFSQPEARVLRMTAGD